MKGIKFELPAKKEKAGLWLFLELTIKQIIFSIQVIVKVSKLQRQPELYNHFLSAFLKAPSSPRNSIVFDWKGGLSFDI